MNSTIPTALTDLRQWVTWRYEDDPKRPDKPKKMPKNPATGNNAQSNNPQTWGAYMQAVSAANGRKHAGVGFVFTSADPFVGGDLDGCRNPETGEIADWAAPWLARLMPVAYIEVSPSGKGVKFVAKGKLTKALKVALGDHTGVELYDTGRFFTITGNRLDGCAIDPLPAQDILDDLYSHYAPVIAVAPTASTREEQPQQPAQDIATNSADWRDSRKHAIDAITKRWVDERVAFACNQLAHAPDGNKHNRRVEMGRLLGGVIAAAPAYLNPTDAANLLLNALPPTAHASTEQKAILDGITTGRESPLPLPTFPTDHDLLIGDHTCCPSCNGRVQRSKYDYPGSNQPGWYCPRCKFPMVWPLEANTGSASTEDSERPTTHDDDSVTALPLLIPASQLGQLPPAIALVPELIYRNRLHLMFGAPGSGKSFVSLDLACTISQYAPVVYLAAEAIEDYETRVESWIAHHGRTVDNLYFWREPIRLAVAADVDRFITMVKAVGPVVIFIDPLADCMSGLVESTQEGMSVAIHALNEIKRGTGAGIVIVHHTGWDAERERGSSVLRGAARVVVKVDQRDDGLINVSCVKKNQGKPFAPRSFRLVASVSAVVPLPSSRVLQTRGDRPTEQMLKVMEELTTQPLRNGATHAQLCKASNLADSTMNRTLTRLTDNGYVACRGEGRNRQYFLTHQGESTLEEALNWGDQLPASQCGSSNNFQTDSLNWSVEVSNLPGNFQHSNAQLPVTSRQLPEAGFSSSTNPLVSIETRGGRSLEVESDLEEEAAIDRDVARVMEYRRQRVSTNTAASAYKALDGY